MSNRIKLCLAACLGGLLIPTTVFGQEAIESGSDAALPTPLDAAASSPAAAITTPAAASELNATAEAIPSTPRYSETPSLSASSSKQNPTAVASKQKESKDSNEINLTREQMLEIFKGDLSSLPGVKRSAPSFAGAQAGGFGLPPSPTPNPVLVTARVRTPDEGLSVAVREIEKQIAKQNEELMKEEDASRKEDLLKKLAQSYKTRFELDTAYQDYRVTEIEERARQLRADVEAREKATQQWVDAMVTLAKMKSDGIETMNLPTSNYGRVITRSYTPSTTVIRPSNSATFPAAMPSGTTLRKPQTVKPAIVQ